MRTADVDRRDAGIEQLVGDHARVGALQGASDQLAPRVAAPGFERVGARGEIEEGDLAAPRRIGENARERAFIVKLTNLFSF